MSAPITPEFSHRIAIEKLSSRAQDIVLEASPAARASLARRFDLLAVEMLRAEVAILKQGRGAHLTGRFEAQVVQRCAISGELVPARVCEPIDLRFEPEAIEPGEVELEEAALDVLAVEDDAVDIAEAVAQSLFLALDPYPRADEAALARVRALILSEEDAEAALADAKAKASPFAALKKL